MVVAVEKGSRVNPFPVHFSPYKSCRMTVPMGRTHSNIARKSTTQSEKR